MPAMHGCARGCHRGRDRAIDVAGAVAPQIRAWHCRATGHCWRAAVCCRALSLSLSNEAAPSPSSQAYTTPLSYLFFIGRMQLVSFPGTAQPLQPAPAAAWWLAGLLLGPCMCMGECVVWRARVCSGLCAACVPECVA
jgi:hypothetical protein